MSEYVSYTGDASILANCLRSQLRQGNKGGYAEENAFRAACCRPIDRSNDEDVRHLADAWKLVNVWGK